MRSAHGRTPWVVWTAIVLACLALAGHADAAGPNRGGGGGQARADGARQQTQVNNNRADARTNNVRSTSVNNVNVQRNVNVNVNNSNNNCCNNGWDNNHHHHPVAAAAAVGVTMAAIGSMVRTVPPGCVPVNYAGIVYQQCGGSWYAPQGSQYVVVAPPY